MTAVQRDLILPQTGSYIGRYDDMDISLLYILLRNVTTISPHSKGWGNDPDPRDSSLSANIERIRLIRNRCVHSSDPFMSSSDFNAIWSTIRSVMVDVDAFLMNGNQYENAVDFLRNESMDPGRDLHWKGELRKQVKEDEKTREMVVSLQGMSGWNYHDIIVSYHIISYIDYVMSDSIIKIILFRNIYYF
jgi:hypothetical protein